MKQMLALVGVVLFGFAAVAANTVTYTVTTDEGTRTAPVALDTLEVEVNDGGTTVTKPFAEACGEFGTASVFRKRGNGWVTSSVRMSTFKGEIRIEEGAFMVTTNGMLGVSAQGNAENAKVYVSDGAALALAATAATCNTSELFIWNEVHVTGTGADGYGAILNCLGNNQYYCFGGKIVLEGDTLLSGHSTYRYDFRDGNTCDMQGHALTIRKGSAGAWSLCPGNAKFINPGHIIIDGVTFHPQSSSSTYGGDASNTLTVTNSANFQFYNSRVSIPWTLIACSGATLTSSGSTSCGCSLGQPDNYNYWKGPVEFRGNTTINATGLNMGFPIHGAISGVGPVTMNSGWLQLMQDNPGYTGSISVVNKWMNDSGCGIALYGNGNPLPAASELSLSNATVNLMNTIPYALPPVTAYVMADTNLVFEGGILGSSYASLTKKGPGSLTLKTPASVTGTLELAEGRLVLQPAGRVYSTASGLWKGVVMPVYTNAVGEVVPSVTNASGAIMRPSGMKNANIVASSTAIMSGQGTLSNEVVSCMDWLKTPDYPPWIQDGSVVWSGYIWNRSPTNETWSFGQTICGYSRFYFDGSSKQSTDNNNRLYVNTVKNVKPGPHAILFKVNPRDYSGPGSNKPSSSPFWGPKMGLALDRLGRGTTNVEDYVFMENGTGSGGFGGDGLVFTRDTRDVTDFAEDELLAAARSALSYSNIVAKAGTVLDLGEGNYYPLPVQTFTGVTTVTNGGLNVCGTWAFAASDITAGGCLDVDGKLSFAGGATVSFDDEGLKLKKPQQGSFTVLRTKDGIENLPEIDYDGDRWRFAVSADGKSLVATYIPPGALIIVK